MKNNNKSLLDLVQSPPNEKEQSFREILKEVDKEQRQVLEQSLAK